MKIFECEIKKEDSEILARLDYECAGHLNLINWLINNNSDMPEQLQQFKKDYMMSFTEKTMFMKQLMHHYIPTEYLRDDTYANFDYISNKVEVYENVSK